MERNQILQLSDFVCVHRNCRDVQSGFEAMIDAQNMDFKIQIPKVQERKKDYREIQIKTNGG